MNELLKKEWREMRLIPLVYAVLIALVVALWYGSVRWQSLISPSFQGFKVSDTIGVLMIGCCFAGWLTGSNTIAPEIGNDTLRFVSALPGGRLRCWISKVFVGTLITLASVLGMVIGYVTAGLILFDRQEFMDFIANLRFYPYLEMHIFQLLLAAACSFAISLLVSTLVDRAAVASVISVILIIVLLITETAAQPIQYGDQWATLIYDNGVILAIGCACLSASISAFLRGETMRTISRFVNAGTVLLVWFLAAGIGLGAYASNTNRYNGQRSESQLLMHAVPQPNMWGRHDDSWFALSDTVRQYRGDFKLSPRDIDAELLPPVKTQLVIPPYFHHSPNIQSWITTKQENQKLVPTLHFIYRLTGREKVIRPGYQFEIHNFPGGEIDQIDLLTQEGAKVGRINLQAVRIITGAHDETTH